MTSDEERPRWWEATDDLPVQHLPSNITNGSPIQLPYITRETWRLSSWPDRPHP